MEKYRLTDVFSYAKFFLDKYIKIFCVTSWFMSYKNVSDFRFQVKCEKF